MRYCRNILIPLILSILAICSCRRTTTEIPGNPALELYHKYADSANLTVAYLCDFEVSGNDISTVMLQANDEDSWASLLNEFAFSQQAMMGITGDTMPDLSYAVEVGMKWDSPMVFDNDIFTKDYLSDEDIEVFAQAIVSQFSSALNSLLESDSQAQNASIIINDDIDMMSDMNFGMEFKDSTAVKRILQAVADRLNSSGLAYNDTLLPADASFSTIEQPAVTMPDAQQHGEDGYIAAIDHINQTIWVFFYDNDEECACILKHIRRDIMVVTPW